MKRSTNSKRPRPEEVVAKRRQADEPLATGTLIAEVASSLEVSEVTFHCWRAPYGAVDGDAMKRLVADQQLDMQIPKEIAKGELRAPYVQSHT